MLRFLRKYMRHMLVVFMALLLVSWLGGQSLRYMLTKQPTGVVIGKAFGQEISRADMIRTGNLVHLFDRLRLPWQQPWGYLPLPRLTEIDWLLVQQEADRWPIQIPARQIDEEFARRGLNEATLALLQERDRIAHQDLRDAMAAFLRVQQYYQLCEAGVKVTEAEVREVCKRIGDRVQARFLILNADDFLEPNQPISEEDGRAHFEKYKDRQAQAAAADDPSALPFGYQYPNRVQVEYIVLRTAALTEELPRPDDIEIYSYWEENRHRLTTTQAAASTQAATTAATQPTTTPTVVTTRPMTLAEAASEIVGTLNRQRAIQLANHQMQDLLESLRSVWAAAPVGENGVRQMPAEVTQTDYYPGVVDRANRGRPGQPFECQRTDWLTIEEALALEGIGMSMVDLGNGQRDFFASRAFQVHGLELAESPAPLLSLYEEPSQVYVDAQGNAYVFRVVAAKSPESPAQWTDVREQVEEDLRRLRGYRRAQQAAQRILERAQTERLRGAFEQDELFPGLEERRDQVLLETPPFPRARLLSVQEAMFSGQALGPPVIPKLGADQGLADAVFELAEESQATTAPAGEVRLLERPAQLRCVLFEAMKTTPMRHDEYKGKRLEVRRMLSVVRRVLFAADWWNAANIRKRCGFQSDYITAVPGTGRRPG